VQSKSAANSNTIRSILGSRYTSGTFYWNKFGSKPVDRD